MLAQNLFYCSKCDYYFVSPHISFLPNEIKKTAEDQVKLRPPENFPEYTSWRKEENGRVIKVVEHFKDFGRVLEIGFGEGHLTENILKRTDEYYGIKPYSSVFKSTTKRLGLNKNRVLCTSTKRLSYLQISFIGLGK